MDSEQSFDDEIETTDETATSEGTDIPVESGSSDDATDWGSFLDEEGDDQEVSDEDLGDSAPPDDSTAKDTSKEEPGTTPKDPPAEEPAAPKEEVKEESAEEETKPETPETAPEQPQGEQWTPEQWQEAHTKYLGELEGRYAFSEEDTAAFNEDPAGHLPKLAARLHSQIFQEMSVALGQVLENALPTMVQNVQKNTGEADALWGTFQDRWTDLAQPDNFPLIREVTQEVRGKMPGASKEKLAQEIGIQVWLRSGRSSAELVNHLAQMEGAATPATPAKQPTQTGGFAPSGGTRTNAAPPPPRTTDPMTAFAEEIMSGEYD